MPNRIVLTTKLWINLNDAARLSGFSIRHFRRIVEEDGLEIKNFGRGDRSKFMLLGATYNKWAKTTTRTPDRKHAKPVKSAKNQLFGGVA